MNERTFDDFDEFADSYRDIHSANIKLSGADSLYFAEMKVRLLQQFENDESIKVLDIGCGDGATELFMQRYFSNWSVNGVDISEKSIIKAKKRGLSNAIFSVYNGTRVPVQDECFDIVFVAGVLHHVEYKFHSAIVKEIFRILKKGGRLYIFEHNPFNPITRYLVNTCVFDKDARLLKSNYTSRLLLKSGLKIKEKHFIIFFPRKGVFTRLIFLEKYLQWLPLGGQYFLRATK